MLRHSSEMLCDECTVKRHTSNPHCMEVLCQGENVFRKPFSHETLTFKLNIQFCRVCQCDNPLGDVQDELNEGNSTTVFVASQNGIFQCTSPLDGSKCQNCELELTCSAVAFDSIPCEPSHKNGATWFTNGLLSFIRTLRCEGGSSYNALARAIMEHWLSRGSFLVNEQGSGNSMDVGNSHTPNMTVHWLEKKLAQVITNDILLEHSSWIDEAECFTLGDRISSVCAACHNKCAQIHIDGFFKMRRMRRPRSYRHPKLRFFGKLDKETVNSYRQADLDNKEQEINECTDLAGNLTDFRAGDGRQQRPHASYSQTGILTAVCPHRVPIAILPMETKGEKFFMVHAMLHFIEQANYPGEVDFYSYDVACRLKSYLQSRDPQLHQRVAPKLVLGYLHSKSHKCRQWNVGFSKSGSGYNDGEQGERLNSWMLKYVAFLRYMREEHMYESIEDFMMSHTWKTNANMDQVLQKKLKHCMSHLFEWHANYVKLCTELENRLSQNGFHIQVDHEEVQKWVESYTARPEAPSSTFAVTGTEAKQEYAWALFEWDKLGANLNTATAALQDINQLGDYLEDCLLDKKRYLLSVVKTYECMAKKRVKVSNHEQDLAFGRRGVFTNKTCASCLLKNHGFLWRHRIHQVNPCCLWSGTV